METGGRKRPSGRFGVEEITACWCLQKAGGLGKGRPRFPGQHFTYWSNRTSTSQGSLSLNTEYWEPEGGLPAIFFFDLLLLWLRRSSGSRGTSGISLFASKWTAPYPLVPPLFFPSIAGRFSLKRTQSWLGINFPVASVPSLRTLDSGKRKGELLVLAGNVTPQFSGKSIATETSFFFSHRRFWSD